MSDDLRDDRRVRSMIRLFCTRVVGNDWAWLSLSETAKAAKLSVKELKALLRKRRVREDLEASDFTYNVRGEFIYAMICSTWPTWTPVPRPNRSPRMMEEDIGWLEEERRIFGEVTVDPRTRERR